MNYIKEINAFYDWLETNSISSSAIVLWHALMAINNKCGWITEFAVATSVLEVKTGLKRRTIERARNELKQKNRIIWKSRKGNQSALYQLVSFYDAQVDAQQPSVRQHSNNFDAQHDAQHDAQTVAINKLNKTKLNETKLINQDVVVANNLYGIFYKSFGKHPTPIQLEKLDYFVNQGLSLDLVSYGLEKTGERGMPFNYCIKIFESWIKKGIFTYKEALEEQELFKGKTSFSEVYKTNKTHSNTKANVSEGKDILYDWLNVSNE